MTTLVGTQTDFADALVSLLELEYDATEAYKVAVDRLENNDYKLKLANFMADHTRHIREITNLLLKKNIEPPVSGDFKQVLAKGKVILGSLIGDEAILLAMDSNEADTNTAYGRMKKHPQIWPEAIEILEKDAKDEAHHKAWIDKTLKSLKHSS